MRASLLLLPLLVLAMACDSGPGATDPPVPSTGPSGTFSIDPVWFEVHVVADENQGFYADYQGWIDGTLTLTEQEGTLSGTGRCTWTKRVHRSWLGETSTETQTQNFTASGTLSGNRVTLNLQGCAWVMVRHTGTFEDDTYELRIPDILSGPLYPPEIWNGAVPLRNTDPFVLTLTRK